MSSTPLSEEAVTRAERALLAALFAAGPAGLLCTLDLVTEDFSRHDHQEVYRSLVRTKRGDVTMVLLDLESRGAAPPLGRGWAVVLDDLLGADCEPSDEAITAYVEAIQSAAVRRRMAARRVRS